MWYGVVKVATEPPGLATGMTIQTLEGEMTAELGDWIIQGVNGEIYACKPDIFALTYERVPDPNPWGEAP